METKDLLASMNKFMFTESNMSRYKLNKMPHVAAATAATHAATATHATATHATATHATAPQLAPARKMNTTFIPFQKDKLFWCFYIILKGHEAYEMNRSSSFSIEKQIKIETVEKMKSVKEKIKEAKLKRTELEDELVNKPMITLKGLYALCLVYNVSITYVFGRKYFEICTDDAGCKSGIIVQNEKKEDALKWGDDDFLTQIRNEYWLIENIQKPLKASSAYTLKELQDICDKLHIATTETTNDKVKAKTKTKTKLYEEILLK